MSPAAMRPVKGTAKAERQKRRRALERAELTAKLAAKARDRWTCRRCGVTSIACEAAHLVDKQSGGDHGLHSGKASDFITLCAVCHRGPRGVHAGFLRVEFGPDGGDGPVAFLDQTPGARHGRCAVDGAVHTEGQFCKGFRPQ